MEGRRRVLGDEHIATLFSVDNMGLLLKEIGRLDEAELYFREAVEKRRRVLGDQHPDTRTSLTGMEDLLRLHVARERRAVARGSDDRASLAEALADHGAHKILLEEYLLAERLLEEAWELIEELGHEESWRSMRILSNLGRAIAGLGRYEEAEALVLGSAEWVLMADLLPAKEETDGVDVAREMLAHVALVYDAWHAAEPDEGRDEEAESWREELDAWAQERAAGDDD